MDTLSPLVIVSGIIIGAFSAIMNALALYLVKKPNGLPPRIIQLSAIKAFILSNVSSFAGRRPLAVQSS